MTTTVAPQASTHWPASIYRHPDGGVERGLSPAGLREIVRGGEVVTAGVAFDQATSQTSNRMNRVMKQLSMSRWRSCGG